ncbi:flippase-like domain-containing protein [Candidatus Saccharibacteria bacterium]|nr:flippase-like domain-containing protein [Candidatus Saccharibacteria bacterium]
MDASSEDSVAASAQTDTAKKQLRWLKPLLSVFIITVTGWLFVRYLHAHPDYVMRLRQTHIGWIIAILLADFAAITTLALLYQVLVRMTGKRLPPTENWLLTIYSSIANFFGPFQSGPGVRAAYLKSKYHVSLRAYFFVTLFSYAVYTVLSAFCLLVGTRPWWQTTLACLLAAGVSALVIRRVGHKRSGKLSEVHITRRLVVALTALTALQITFICLRYYLALRAGGAQLSLGQAVSYTGAANFALFVSITPDGIGIREAFLLFAQHIHLVSTDAIVTANIIDRATFVVFLGLLFMVALGLHAKDRFKS